jgi:hypothetical protein
VLVPWDGSTVACLERHLHVAYPVAALPSRDAAVVVLLF